MPRMHTVLDRVEYMHFINAFKVFIWRGDRFVHKCAVNLYGDLRIVQTYEYSTNPSLETIKKDLTNHIRLNGSNA